MNKILIIEDDKAIVEVIEMILKQGGFEVDYAYDGVIGLEKFKNFKPDVVLLDIRMPRMDGIEVLQELKIINRDVIVIMISGHGNVETAVQTTKLGAYDFISKPFDVDRLKLTIQNGLNYFKLLCENKRMKNTLDEGDELIGSSKIIIELREIIKKFASVSARVLIFGENGTGKELVAREIHKLSDRVNGPFVEINCSTVPSELIEVELFGVEENFLNYSPAKRIGRFELANGGSIFLDEIGDLNLEAQGKLMTVVTDNLIEPLGSTTFIPVDVRIISSTNKDMNKLISEGKFREDLYHRLNVLNVIVPTLRDRIEDIPGLINYFTEKLCRLNNLPLKKFSQSAVDFLSSLMWKGNVRELKNTIERLIILSDSDFIEKSSIEKENPKFLTVLDKVMNSQISLHEFQNESEKIFIEKKLEENDWNISKTADSLSIQRSHLYTKIKQFKIEIPGKSSE